MPLDSSVVSCLRHEFTNIILGCKIEKVYQPEKDEIHLLLKSHTFNGRLLISADTSNPQIHITKSFKENPMSAPLLCMLLRKHLSGGKIKAVTEPDFERVLDIEIECYSELGDLQSKHIIVEIMGKHSNIIFTDHNMRIIDSAKHVDITVSSVRNILPGLTYTAPPSQSKQNPLILNLSEIENALSSIYIATDTSISQMVLSHFTGISPLAAREIAYRATGDVDTLLTEKNMHIVAETFMSFMTDIKNGNFSPCVLFKKSSGEPFDFSAFNVTLYKELAYIKYYVSVSDAMDDYFVARDKLERMRQKGNSLRKTVTNILDRLRKKLILQENKLKEVQNKEQIKAYGELVTSNMYKINYGDKFARVENFYEASSPLIDIPLDNTLSPSQNAQKYFKKYRKAKTAEKIVSEQHIITIAEIDYIESVLHSITSAESISELAEIKSELCEGGYIRTPKVKVKVLKKGKTPKSATITLREYTLPGGYELLVGKNNKQNDYLTLKVARNNDLWFHVKGSPGSHVVLRSLGEAFENTTVETAAKIAAYFSKANHAVKVEVAYTEIRNVKKPSGAKPGMVIYDKYKTIYVAPTSPDDICTPACDKINT